MEKCKQCNATVDNEYQFCPNCGTPLTATAEIYRKQEKRSAILDALVVLTNNIKDPSSLKVIADFINQVNKK